MKSINSTDVDPLICGCVLRWTCGLPCVHELAELKRDSQVIQLKMIDKFWRKLYSKPTMSENSVDADIGSR